MYCERPCPGLSAPLPPEVAAVVEAAREAAKEICCRDMDDDMDCKDQIELGRKRTKCSTCRLRAALTALDAARAPSSKNEDAIRANSEDPGY